MKNQPRGVLLRYVIEPTSPNSHLLERILSKENMQKAWKRKKSEQGGLGIWEYYRPIPKLDHWLRRRIRMCYWKQWRKTKTKVRNILKLGTYKKHAIFTGLSRKGPWHLSKTLATQTGMTNSWLAKQGLLSIKELWVNIHYPAWAR